MCLLVGQDSCRPRWQKFLKNRTWNFFLTRKAKMSCPNEYISIKKYNDIDFLYHSIPLNGEYLLEESVAKKECDKRSECDGLLYNNSNGQFVMRKGMKLNKEFYENPSSTNTFCVKKDMIVNSPNDDSMPFFKSVPHRTFKFRGSKMREDTKLLNDVGSLKFEEEDGESTVKKIENNPITTVLNVEEINCDPKTTILKDGVCISIVEEINCDPKTTILKDGVCVAKSNTNNEVMTWPLLIFKLAMASK